MTQYKKIWKLNTAYDYTVFINGGCIASPRGPGGYGVVMIDNKSKKISTMSEGFDNTTENRMEILAATMALRSLPRGCSCILYSSSKYFVNCFTGAWKRNKNQDLFGKAQSAAKGITLDLKLLPNSEGNIYSELCENLTMMSMQQKNLKVDVLPREAMAARKAKYADMIRPDTSVPISSMSSQIVIPLEFQTEIEIMSQSDYAAKYHVNHECAAALLLFASKTKHVFSDYAKLKTYGFDYWSRKSLNILTEYLNSGEEILSVVESYIPYEKECSAAMRWRCRGLPLEHSIRKVLVDSEVQNTMHGI